MDPVVHFEMPADDRQRMADFYAKVFGWKSQMMGEEMGNYVSVVTTEMGEDGRPKQPGAINGGFFQRSDDSPSQHPLVVIWVDDTDAKLQEVTAAGGEIVRKPMDIPGVGRYGSFRDTEGNLVSVLSALPDQS